MLRKTFAGIALVAGAAAALRAQDTASVRVTYDDRGLVFSAPARATEVTMRFYIQPLFLLQGDGDGGAMRRITLQLRRTRLGFTGTTFDPRLRFNLQLGLSRADIETETPGNVNLVADANVVWNWTPNLWTMVGQGKIFGDRQEINAASELEFPDRTIVYTAFGPDRDAGVMSGYTHALGAGPFTVRASVTSGEGRNSTTGDAHLAYGGRVDWQPLGAFKGNGAFSESDLLREPNARFAVGAAFLYDEGATRLGGLNGSALFAPRDIRTTFVDAIWKRRGVAVEAEYVQRYARDPITSAGPDVRAVYAGYGLTGQASYALKSGFLPAVRVSAIVPNESIYGAPTGLRKTEIAAELARYLRGHHLKWQLEFGHDESKDPLLGTSIGSLYSRLSLLAGL